MFIPESFFMKIGKKNETFEISATSYYNIPQVNLRQLFLFQGESNPLRNAIDDNLDL